MAEVSRRRKKHKHELEPQEPSKEEMKMAKYVRFNTPKKSTVLQKENVEYFVGSKAVDTLMKSKWSKQAKTSVAILQSRGDAVRFMEQLLLNNMLYRAKKVLKEPKQSKDDQKPESTKKSQEEKSEKVRKRKKNTDDKEKEEGEAAKAKESEAKKTEDKKKKKKYKLDVHEEQIFLDSSDVYVWVYDPLSPKKMLLGGVVVLGIIGATLFPLWPPSVRIGVYYLSVCGGIFVGAILGIALCRSLLFAFIWVVTLGKHRVWFLPNLLADVGFFDSFKPVYTHEVNTKKDDESPKKDKNSDSEGESAQSPPLDDVDEPETISTNEKEDEIVDDESSQKINDDDPPLDGDNPPLDGDNPPPEDDGPPLDGSDLPLDGDDPKNSSDLEKSDKVEDDRGSASDYEIIEESLTRSES